MIKEKIKNRFRASLLSTIALFLGSVSFVMAASQYLVDPITGRDDGSMGLTVSDFIAKVAIMPFLSLIGAGAFGLFVYGGFLMMFSAGNDSQVKKGIDVIRKTVIGLVIIFASYAIVEFILRFLERVGG